mmetsp:Transcript_83316/g.222777  ORF Transcript_83316/g.222777 Transcript_83316/m.222777 type:complete len:229 (+) Transcript_83316:993-1679(+)
MHHRTHALTLPGDLLLHPSWVVGELLLLLSGWLGCARESLVLLLGGVEQQSLQCLGLVVLGLRRESRVFIRQHCDHVTVRRGIVGFIQSLAQNDLDHLGHLRRVFQLDLLHAGRDGVEIFRGNLVQQRSDLTLQLLLPSLRGGDLVCVGRGLRQGGGGLPSQVTLRLGSSHACSKHRLTQATTAWGCSRPQSSGVPPVDSRLTRAQATRLVIHSDRQVRDCLRGLTVV